MNYKWIYMLQLTLSSFLVFGFLLNSIGNIYGLHSDISNLKQLEINSGSTGMELNSLKRENDELKKSLLNIRPEELADNLLSIINKHSAKLRLHKMDKAKVYNQEKVNLIELKMVMEGGFKETLIFCNELEKRKDLGRIVSLEMEKRKTLKSRSELYSTIIINVLSQYE